MFKIFGKITSKRNLKSELDYRRWGTMKIDILIVGTLVLAISVLILMDGILSLIDSPILFEGLGGGFKVLVAFVFTIPDSQILEKIEN